MKIIDADKNTVATVLRVGAQAEGGRWAVGRYAFSTALHSRTRRTDLGLEFAYAFYIELPDPSPYRYDQPHIWLITITPASSRLTSAIVCVYDLSFNARRARNTQHLYNIGALQILETWRTGPLSDKCIPLSDLPDYPENQDEHILNMVEALIKPVDRSFQGIHV